MKKVTLDLGGTMYAIHFEVSTIQLMTISIKSIMPLSGNCISIMGFNLNDIRHKIVLSQKKWSDV